MEVFWKSKVAQCKLGKSRGYLYHVSWVPQGHVRCFRGQREAFAGGGSAVRPHE